MRITWVTAPLAVAALALSGLSAPVSASAVPIPPIAWHGCTTGPSDEAGPVLDAAGAECGEVTVPVDYRELDDRTIAVAVTRKRATDQDRRRGVLMLNPGGPGTSALEMVLAGPLMPEVAAAYDLVAMDPRFVGRSNPIDCRWKTDTFLRGAGPDRSTFTASVTLARDLAAGCAADRTLLPHASTRNTARDMDRVRRALGESRISYLGYSYGTYLGAVYLQMFGDHADRVVLDSAVDPSIYGPGLFARSAPAIQAALENWASWAAEHHAEYGLGATRNDVLTTVERLDQKTTTAGLYEVDAHVLPLLLFTGLYDDGPEVYASLAGKLRALRTGTPDESLTQFLTMLFTGSGPASDRAGTPILCADRAVSRDPATYYRDIQRHRAAEPLFGPLTRNISPCAFWPARPAEPATVIGNRRPALVVGADGDPATPYAGQQVMHEALAGSRMVTLRGRFGHGQYLVAGNGCVDGAVNRYLLDGVLPTGDIHCVS
ncbi:alpha/beta hydrolase [Actinoplanes derwentensis]|uniref:Alpha/beta hydrolase fold n=1 Tax=Actinoplanes derwentensis TaxID=113562 RepID=A0A1H2A648_9ACTN|nr:alpha/beta hydrolase [Actinoplanes derwentensis]GID90357.1 alpha/beta hydrolase [Actinoplanes derwentensis]SDT41353.1 alpha/beta hydrolase fold [Actinoplanes derwentensis]